MTGAPILLLGAGGHARACIDVVEAQGRFSIAGLVGAPDEVGREVLGYPVLGTDADLSRLLSEFHRAVVVVGQIKSPEARIRLFAAVCAAGAELPTIVSPYAYVSCHATLGAGTMVLHGAVVNAGARVGHNAIINTKALVEHDAVIGDHCHVATAAVVNGGAVVGAGSFVGSNACVRQNVQVGACCVIGMGQRVLTDCADGTRLPPEGERG